MNPEPASSARATHETHADLPWFAFTVGDDRLVIDAHRVDSVVSLDAQLRLPIAIHGIGAVGRVSGTALALLDPRATGRSADGARVERALHLRIDGEELLLACDAVAGVRAESGAEKASPELACALAPQVEGTVSIDGVPHGYVRAERLLADAATSRSTASRSMPKMLVVLEHPDRTVAIPGDPVVGIHRDVEADAHTIDLDAWLGAATDDARPERLLELSDGRRLRTRARLEVVPIESVTCVPMPRPIAEAAAERGLVGLLLRGERLGLLVDPRTATFSADSR